MKYVFAHGLGTILLTPQQEQHASGQQKMNANTNKKNKTKNKNTNENNRQNHKTKSKVASSDSFNGLFCILYLSL